MHIEFIQYLCIQYIYQQNTDTFNTIKLKIGLRHPSRDTPVVKGKRFREQTFYYYYFYYHYYYYYYYYHHHHHHHHHYYC